MQMLVAVATWREGAKNCAISFEFRSEVVEATWEGI